MVDHIRTLLLNRGGSGYSPVSDAPSSRALALFGVTGDGSAADESAVDVLLPLALAPDLSWFSSRFDQRTTPAVRGSAYRTVYGEFTLDGLSERVRGTDGRWAVSQVFDASDPYVHAELSKLRESFVSMDAPYALGAVLLACAYRRDILREGGRL